MDVKGENNDLVDVENRSATPGGRDLGKGLSGPQIIRVTGITILSIFVLGSLAYILDTHNTTAPAGDGGKVTMFPVENAELEKSKRQ
eukprot:8113090-Pyramimonas_sp.AAC.1